MIPLFYTLFAIAILFLPYPWTLPDGFFLDTQRRLASYFVPSLPAHALGDDSCEEFNTSHPDPPIREPLEEKSNDTKFQVIWSERAAVPKREINTERTGVIPLWVLPALVLAFVVLSWVLLYARSRRIRTNPVRTLLIRRSSTPGVSSQLFEPRFTHTPSRVNSSFLLPSSYQGSQLYRTTGLVNPMVSMIALQQITAYPWITSTLRWSTLNENGSWLGLAAGYNQQLRLQRARSLSCVSPWNVRSSWFGFPSHSDTGVATLVGHWSQMGFRNSGSERPAWCHNHTSMNIYPRTDMLPFDLALSRLQLQLYANGRASASAGDPVLVAGQRGLRPGHLEDVDGFSGRVDSPADNASGLDDAASLSSLSDTHAWTRPASETGAASTSVVATLESSPFGGDARGYPTGFETLASAYSTSDASTRHVAFGGALCAPPFEESRWITCKPVAMPPTASSSPCVLKAEMDASSSPGTSCKRAASILRRCDRCSFQRL